MFLSKYNSGGSSTISKSIFLLSAMVASHLTFFSGPTSSGLHSSRPFHIEEGIKGDGFRFRY